MSKGDDDEDFTTIPFIYRDVSSSLLLDFTDKMRINGAMKIRRITIRRIHDSSNFCFYRKFGPSNLRFYQISGLSN